MKNASNSKEDIKAIYFFINQLNSLTRTDNNTIFNVKTNGLESKPQSGTARYFYEAVTFLGIIENIGISRKSEINNDCLHM